MNATLSAPRFRALRLARRLLNEGETLRTHREVDGVWQWVHYDQMDVARMIDREMAEMDRNRQRPRAS